MSRGIEESIYVKLQSGVTAADLKKKLIEQYKDEPFVHIIEGSAPPQTRHVRGSNMCFINVYQDRVPGRAIILSVIGKICLSLARIFPSHSIYIFIRQPCERSFRTSDSKYEYHAR